MLNIEFITSDRLNQFSPSEKISYLVDKVKQSSIVVIEHGLTVQEEMKVIEATMHNIDFQHFSGVNMLTFDSKRKAGRFFGKLMSGKYTIITPSGISAIKEQKDGEINISFNLETPLTSMPT